MGLASSNNNCSISTITIELRAAGVHKAKPPAVSPSFKARMDKLARTKKTRGTSTSKHQNKNTNKNTNKQSFFGYEATYGAGIVDEKKKTATAASSKLRQKAGI